MGPLYHLIDREDRQAAISEVVNRLLPGAPFFSSHINRYGMLTDVMVKFPHWAEDSDAVESVVSLGRDPDDTPRDGRFRSYFATVEEIESLHEECGIETILIAASDLGSNPFDRIHESMTDDQREKWIDLMQQAGAQPALRGASCHLLYIGRRPQSE